MELPARSKSDIYVPPGEFARLSANLRGNPETGGIVTLLVTAFDPRTRMLPFILWDRQIVPAGIRAVSAALSGAGFTRQRVVNQSWTPNVLPSVARIDGASPELLLVSAMQIHSGQAYNQIRDAHRMGSDRPLIIAGGPKAIYQPWDFFGFDEAGHSADIVCTGEEYVLIELLDRLIDCKFANETLLAAFERARVRGWLDDIPGLLYDRTAFENSKHELVDTGVQRLVQDFDELPPPVEGYRFLERPHQSRFLRRDPIPAREIGHYSKVSSILTTRGCKFRCGYCPIPAYNQFTFRNKSPEGLVRDISGIRRKLGIHIFFGTDDNFFNNPQVVQATFEALARAEFEKDDIGKPARFATEATEFDVHKQLDMLPLCYRGGLRMIWFGIEDMTATLVKKGQSVSKTSLLFTELRRQRIQPMAMMMHYDGQQLISKGSMSGLLNQVRFLFNAGAASLQVTVLIPATGTKDYDGVLSSGIILKTLGRDVVEDAFWDGNRVISVGASTTKPWNQQLHVLLAYGLFYNPVNFLRRLFMKGWKWSDLFMQVWGMWGLAITSCRLLGWQARLRKVAKGDYSIHKEVPRSRWQIVAPETNGTDEEQDTEYVRQTIGANDTPVPAQKLQHAVLSKY